MCRKYYRDCSKCGRTVHLNDSCVCGGEPWGKDSVESFRLTYLRWSIPKNKQQVEELNNQIIKNSAELEEMESELSV